MAPIQKYTNFFKSPNSPEKQRPSEQQKTEDSREKVIKFPSISPSKQTRHDEQQAQEKRGFTEGQTTDFNIQGFSHPEDDGKLPHNNFEIN